MDPNGLSNSNIFLSKYILSAPAIVWQTVKEFYNGQFLRQSASLPANESVPLELVESISSSASALPAETTFLVTSDAETVALPPVAISDNLVLPQTLLLRCFSSMSLKCLIFSRCVCSDWRKLVPLSEIHPTRRRFLKLYDRMLANQLFLESRIWTMDNLKPFDRDSYIATLREQFTGPEAEIPEDFYMYILEWPARMAIGCMWPGLPFVDSQTDGIQRQFGINYLALPPQLSALVFKHQLPEACFIPGLLTWRTPSSTSWLVFDKTPHDRFGFSLHGRVFNIALYPTPYFLGQVNDATIIPYDYEEDTGSDLYDDIFEGRCWSVCSGNVRRRLSSAVGTRAKLSWQDMETFIIYPSWIAYLETCWTDRAEPFVNPYSGKIRPVNRDDTVYPDIPLDDLVEEMGKEGYEYLDRSYRDVPAPPWTRRGEAKFQGRLVTGSIPPGSNVHVYLS